MLESAAQLFPVAETQSMLVQLTPDTEKLSKVSVPLANSSLFKAKATTITQPFNLPLVKMKSYIFNNFFKKIIK